MGQAESKEMRCAQCAGTTFGEDKKCQTCGALYLPRKTTLQTLFSRKDSSNNSAKSLRKIPSKLHMESNSFSKGSNYALIFIKPSVPKSDLIRSRFESHFNTFKVTLTSEGTLTAGEIADKGIIDQHYAALATNAMDLNPPPTPSQLTPELAQKFQQEFGVEYSNPKTVLTLGQFLDQTKHLALPETALDEAWAAANNKLKIAGGFYVGRLEALEGNEAVCPNVRPLLIVNGFYNSMRRDYLREPNTVLYFTVEWKEADLSWKDFRSECIGATNPAMASKRSLRGKMLEYWKELGLSEAPDVTRNCVHASAGPIEALRERATWVQIPLEQDPFTKMLLEEGVPMEFIARCAKNETITVEGKTGPAFDLFEDMDSSAVIRLALEASKAQ